MTTANRICLRETLDERSFGLSARSRFWILSRLSVRDDKQVSQLTRCQFPADDDVHTWRAPEGSTMIAR
jgi:hypothetical protein